MTSGNAVVAPPVHRWRDHEPKQFAQTVLVAAEQLGVQPLAVEKDYWVCEALRAIVASHPAQVIFKGGTSLEKLRLIRRFSEDLDLLVVGSYAGVNAAKRAMKEMCESAATGTGAEQTKLRSGGKLGAMHRAAWLRPPLTHEPTTASAIADARAVLLELGQSGGQKPFRTHSVSSLLTRQLLAVASDFDVNAYDDLKPFDVDVLHPGRTLLEKLLRINNFVTGNVQDDVHGWPRIGRQFYDVWALLGDESTVMLLQDRPAAAEILTSCYEVSLAFDSPDLPVPTGGFASCSAFHSDGAHAAQLRQEHDLAMRDLYYGQDDPPSFDDVLERVAAHADLLDISA